MPNLGFSYEAPSAITPELTNLVWGDPAQEYRKQQQQLAQQKQSDLENQRRLENQEKGIKFVNDNTKQLDPLKDPAAEVVNGQIGDLRTKYSKRLHDNPTENEMNVESDMQDDLDKINTTANNIRSGAARIHESVQGWGKLPGANTYNLEQAARDKMMYDTDANGKKTLKSTIDPLHDHAGDVIHDDPSSYVNGDAAMDYALKGIDKNRSPISDVEKTDHRGVKIQSGMKGTVASYQHPIYDPKTNKITGVATNAVDLVNPQTGKPMPDPGNNNKNLQGVDDATFAQFNTPTLMAQLKGDVDQGLKASGKYPQDPTSPLYHAMLKHALLLRLDASAKKDIIPVNNQDNTAAVDKKEAGIGTILGQVESRAEKKHDDQLTGSNYGRLVEAVNGDPKILDAGTPEAVTVGGKHMYLTNITDAVGGFSTNADTKLPTGEQYSKIRGLYIDRKNPGKLYVHEMGDPSNSNYDPESDNGHMRVLGPKEVENMMRRHGPENGFAKNSNDIDRLLKLKPWGTPPVQSKVNPREQKILDEVNKAKNNLKVINSQ